MIINSYEKFYLSYYHSCNYSGQYYPPYISQYYSVFFILLTYLKSQYYLFNLFNQIDNQ